MTAIKSTYCSCRRHRLWFPAPTRQLITTVTLVTVILDLNPSSGLHRPLVCIWHTYIHSCTFMWKQMIFKILIKIDSSAQRIMHLAWGRVFFSRFLAPYFPNLTFPFRSTFGARFCGTRGCHNSSTSVLTSLCCDKGWMNTAAAEWQE